MGKKVKHVHYKNESYRNDKHACVRLLNNRLVFLLLGIAFGLVLDRQWNSDLGSYLSDFKEGIGQVTEGPNDNTPTSKYQYVPCQIHLKDTPQVTTNTTASETARRFHISPIKCRQEVSDRHFLVVLEFEVKECPPHYSASTFQLQTSTEHSRMMGHVGNRYKVKNGCGYQKATAYLMDPGGTATLELFWTTNYRHYSNHLEDVEIAHKIKTENLGEDAIAPLLTEERQAYLNQHLDPVPGTPLQFKVELQSPPPSIDALPDCADVPVPDWSPAGTFQSEVQDPYNADLMNEVTGKPFGQRWPYRAARCYFPYHSLDQWNDLLAGIRIRELGDSHGNYVREQVWDITCPGIPGKDVGVVRTKLFYDCPNRTNSFQYVWRYFLSSFQSGQQVDMDFGVSTEIRQGKLEACQHALGLGLYNVTVLMITHWMFVYETQEGMDNHLNGLKDMMVNCREAFPEQMKDQVFLVQTPSARNSDPMKDVHNAWRGIHNHRMEEYSRRVKEELQPYIDGVIPMYEMTFARLRDEKTNDPVHLMRHSYRDMAYVQFAAARSALLHSWGVETPMMDGNDPKARWFVNVDMDTV